MDEGAPGFRFFPTEEELVSFYLSRKLDGDHLDLNRVIPVVDIYQLDPWYLPEHSGEVCRGDPEQWFFFCPRQEREARGGRPNRITNSGYWKATGSPMYVFSSGNKIIGMKKTMVFYKGKSPTGKKTKWKMNEYKAVDGEAAISSTSTPKLRHELSLCRVYIKSGCLRAFDRRPPGTTDQAPLVHQFQVANVTLASHQSPPNAGRTSSPDTSISGDDTVHTSQMGSAADWEVAQDLDQLWEWDQMDWP